MPGTIHASVLEVADLPSIQGVYRGDRFFLKVSLGKMEFRTDNCEGDFSFPVSSLRDNLVITLHSAEGSEISRAVIKTVQVMESGFLESWFPLKGGGNAHMIFQFSLDENDRKRIYEKRESALKTSYSDLNNSGRRHSFSEGLLRPSTANAAENTKESCSTKSAGKRSNSISTGRTSIIPEHLISGDDSATFLSTKIGHSSEKQNGSKKHSSSAVKKMTSSFETSLLQDDTPRPCMELTKSSLKKIGSTGSMKEVCSDKGMLIEMGQEQTSGYLNSVPINAVEDRSTLNKANNPETSMTRLNVVNAIILHHEAAMYGGMPEIKQTSQTNFFDLQEGNEFSSPTNEQKSSIAAIHVKSIQGCHKDEGNEPKEHDEPQSSSNLPLSDDSSSYPAETVEPGESSESETIDGNSKPFGSSACMEQTSVNSIRTESASARSRKEFVASTASQISTSIKSSHISADQEQLLASNNAARPESLDGSNDGYMESSAWLTSRERLHSATETCLLWYPSFWKRRPCLTTAAGQIFYKLNGYDLLATHPQTTIDLNTFKEHKMHGGPVESALKNETSRDSEKPWPECILPVSKISKGLVEQGLKVILLVFACGTLILTTRAS